MVIVQTEDFNSAELIAGLHERTATHAGALVTFTGYVRDYATKQETRTLFLEHYPGMCEREIGDICLQAQTRWNTAEPVVVHRVGEMHNGEQIVFVGVASPHRGDAFRACEFIIDALKTRAPFWKRETLENGEQFWVQQRESDTLKTQEWETGQTL
ncbi:MAG TPA: molybdenum cofactor biosynthesis protein MoaE [Pusillimonas sp.]|jgi:molybdopterin synthase catalytic subunit|nr:molybdenum cofactor biosynthesis protein MoaE [Pusillimonas sp.]MBC43141.1 molybdenum cofactor biosynthesis protein MoaE [Pusillimonas sp.]HBT32086.1 molybdenum cofactor biosynthesis protein MoaE [Pusillimonas sp.]HCN70746.1 molybdenum cofactor biosynthesis protein MoaE [Pusillimonas sp.]|tara:strand:+ start:63910 stop:64377 length:468 start_codon:yes stop_codon:yes gene_type:complete